MMEKKEEAVCCGTACDAQNEEVLLFLLLQNCWKLLLFLKVFLGAKRRLVRSEVGVSAPTRCFWHRCTAGNSVCVCVSARPCPRARDGLSWFNLGLRYVKMI